MLHEKIYLILCDVCYSALLKAWKNNRTNYFFTTNIHFIFVNDQEIIFLANTYLFKFTIETLEKGVKYVQS